MSRSLLPDEPVNPVLPSEGRWLAGDASARAAEEAGVQSDLIRTPQATFQLSQKLFLGLEDCMLPFWSLFSRSLMYSSPVEELALLNEDHKRDINSTGEIPTLVLDSKTIAEAGVVAESAEDMFPSFKCMVYCDGLRRDGNHETHTRLQHQRMGDASFLKEETGELWQKMASQKYIYEIKRARGEPVTSWINRSDEALMDIRKKLATAPGANSSESTMIPPQNQGWLLLHSEIERSGHCWSHDHDRRQLKHQTC